MNSRRYRDDSHAVRYPDDDPVLMTLIHDIDIAQWVTGSDFHSNCRPAIGRRRLPIDDGDVGDQCDRGDLRPAHGLDIH